MVKQEATKTNKKPAINEGAAIIADIKKSVILASNASMPPPIQPDPIRLRPAKPDDAPQLRALIQELADHHDEPEGPKIGAGQLSADFASGAMAAMVALGAHGEMAAYACYFLQPSSSNSRGQVLHLEDLYIRSSFRRKGLGIRLLREMAKIAHALRLPCIEWHVQRTNYGAVKFYNTLPGLEDLTDRREANKAICWRLESDQYAHILRKANNHNGPSLAMEVLMDQTGQCPPRKAQRLAEQWLALQQQLTSNAVEERKATTAAASVEERKQAKLLAKLLQAGQLGAICARASDTAEQSLLGMAFFHRKAYSTWRGKFPELDKIHVAEGCRRKGVGTAIMAELVKIARDMGATKVQWTAPEWSKAKSQHVPFFKSLNASNLADSEGWLLYRWHYEQSGLHEKENMNTKEDIGCQC